MRQQLSEVSIELGADVAIGADEAKISACRYADIVRSVNQPRVRILLGTTIAGLGLVEFVAAFLRWGRVDSLDMSISGMGSVSVPGADAHALESFTAMPGIVTAIVGLVAIGAGAVTAIDRAPRARGWIALLAGLAGTVHAAIAAATPQTLLFDDSWRQAAEGQDGSATATQYGVFVALVAAAAILVIGVGMVTPGAIGRTRRRR